MASFKVSSNSAEFQKFANLLADFISMMIGDIRFALIKEQESKEPRFYFLEHFKSIIEDDQSIFGTVWVVIKFFLNFDDNLDVLTILVVILRRLFNFFPDQRAQLEDPIMRVLFGCLKQYKIALTDKYSKNLEHATKLYCSAQNWFDFLIDSEHVGPEFKQKLKEKELLKFFMKEGNRGKFLAGMDVKKSKFYLKHTPTNSICCSIGLLKERVIKAGESFSVPVIITKVNSILCVNFETEEHDILFGLFKAHDLTEFKDQGEHIYGEKKSDTAMTPVVPLTLIESRKKQLMKGEDGKPLKGQLEL